MVVRNRTSQHSLLACLGLVLGLNLDPDWLNQAEIEIRLFSRQCLGTRRIADLATLRREAAAWNRRVNREQVKINWRFDRKTARRNFGYKRPFIRRSKN